MTLVLEGETCADNHGVRQATAEVFEVCGSLVDLQNIQTSKSLPGIKWTSFAAFGFKNGLKMVYFYANFE